MALEYKKEPNKVEEIEHILHPYVKKWFFSKFSSFSLPQLYGVMDIHSRKNILVSAPTGASKTLTGFLSILNELIDSSEKEILEDRIYCVYVSPLKALNNDIHLNLIEPLGEIEKIAGKRLGIRVAVRTGDTTASEKSNMLKNPPHILITTPESLAILLTSPKFSEHLRNVEWLIVDEIHALAENKRGVHLSLSLERLNCLSQHITRIGLSATVAPLDEVAQFLVGNELTGEDKGRRDCSIVDVQLIKNMDIKVLSPVPDLIDTEHGVMHHKMYELIDKLIQAHKTTLIFTNTRSATERVVDHLKEKFPKNYAENIGAHHSSLSAVHRRNIEKRLRNGELKVCVSSTSLELGIDIGYVDLVICLGSPKSVARFLQRAGRAGHRLHDTVNGRIIVLDRDDLVECAVLLKSAMEKKIDRIHIPKNALDVLAQQLFGMALERKWHFDEMFDVVRKSYCYKGLPRKYFADVVDYLSGKYASLEDRHVYAKIWHDENTGEIGRKGRLGRVIYMTNIGTIPDETFVTVKAGNDVIGNIDEGFLERLKRGDVFVLGGEHYEFLYSKGMVAQVRAAYQRPPTIPSWFSEMLPLSFDLSQDIGKFRALMQEKLREAKPKEEMLKFINEYLYVDDNSANSIYEYFKEQFDYAGEVPHAHKILIEHYEDQFGRKAIFHALFGRRVNDVLSRAVAFAVSMTQHRDVEMGITDNGFYLSSKKPINAMAALKLLKSEKLGIVMRNAIERTEVLRRRFRHCASRALMILRNYRGKTKRVGRQQVSSMLLMSAVMRIDPDFSILREARREVLEDLMDVENARKILKMIEEGKIAVKEIHTKIPTPFAFCLAFMGYVDVLKIEEKAEFLRRMHQMVKAKIGLNKGING